VIEHIACGSDAAAADQLTPRFLLAPYETKSSFTKICAVVSITTHPPGSIDFFTIIYRLAIICTSLTTRIFCLVAIEP
jgi:hypothetical protein